MLRFLEKLSDQNLGTRKQRNVILLTRYAMTRKTKDANFFFEKYALAQDATLFGKDAQARDATLFWRRAPSSGLLRPDFRFPRRESDLHSAA